MMNIKKSKTAWRQYADKMPANFVCIGQLDNAALLENQKQGTKYYALKKHGVLEPLDGKQVSIALGKQGRPSVYGRRMSVILSDAAIAKAKRLGGGNVSAGLRAWGDER